jgi:MFS family permease
MFIATFTSFAQGVGPLALAPMFPAYIEDFNSNLEDVIQFTGIAILVLGFSNFVWIPILNCFGRRPCLILSTVICLGAQIWRAQATSYGSFMGASMYVISRIPAPCHQEFSRVRKIPTDFLPVSMVLVEVLPRPSCQLSLRISCSSMSVESSTHSTLQHISDL